MKTKPKPKIGATLLVAVTLFSALLLPLIQTANATTYYTVTFSASVGGSIYPSGTQSLPTGTYDGSAYPGPGYIFNGITTSGGVSARLTHPYCYRYTVSGDGSVYASYVPISSPPPSPPASPPPTNISNVENAITLGLDWLDRMAYKEINSTHAVAIEGPTLGFRIKRSDGYWTIFGKKTETNLPPSATMIRGGCLDPQSTTDDLGLITGAVDRQRFKYYWDIDGDKNYNDVILYIEYAAMDNDDARVAGKIVSYTDKGVSLQLYLENDQVISSVALNQQFQRDKQWGWVGNRYTIRPTTKGLADLYVRLGTTQYSWLGGQTYQQTRGINYLDRALKLYRTWYGSGYILDRFDGQYGSTVIVRPWAGQNGIPNYPANPDLIVEPWYGTSGDLDAYIDNNNKTAGWYNYNNLPESTTYRSQGKIARFTTVSRSIMPDDTEWNNLPFHCSDTEFIYAYKSRTSFNYARNQYIANGLEFDLLQYNDLPFVVPGLDLVLGIGTDAKSIRACHDMYKYGANVPYGLSTLKSEFIDSAQWDGNGIARDSWHGSPIGWQYPAYGTHNTATYANALTQYYKLTSDPTMGIKADETIGTLLMLQNKLGQPVYSRSKTQSYYRAEYIGSFLPGYAVAYSFGQQDIYSSSWIDTIYGFLNATGIFQEDPQATAYPVIGNTECTIPSVWSLIEYRTTNRTPKSPQQPEYTLTFQDNAVAYTDHGGSWGGDGAVEIVSSNLQSTYIGGDTGNLYKHTGQLDRIRMNADGETLIGQGWSSIQYEWNLTLVKPSINWKAKVYFTIPDWMAFIFEGGNSLTVTVYLYNSQGQLITQDSRIPIDAIEGTTGGGGTGGKMVFYNDMAKTAYLAPGTYTVKLKFYCHAGAQTYIGLGYQCDPDQLVRIMSDPFGSLPRGLPMGIEYFGWENGFYDNFDDNTINTERWEPLQVNGATVNETNSQLEVTLPSGTGWAQAGYVTKNAYCIQNLTATINVTEHNNLNEMSLLICNTKTNNSDPFNESNWYRITKMRQGYSTNIITVERKFNGVHSVITTSSWASPTGQLKITVTNETISFYENSVLKYSEFFALPNLNCYIYAYTSSPRETASGTGIFDDFLLSRTFYQITRIQGNARGTATYPSSTISVTMSSTPTEGNLLILAYGAHYSNGRTISNITQTGVIWTEQVSKYSNGYGYCSIWAGVVSSGASTNITVNLSGQLSSNYGAIVDVCEYSGLLTTGFLDKTATNQGGSTTLTDTGTTTMTSQTDELWIGVTNVNQAQTTPTTNGFTLLDGATYGTFWTSLAYLEKIVTSSGTANSGATLSSSGYWVGCIVTFKAAT